MLCTGISATTCAEPSSFATRFDYHKVNYRINKKQCIFYMPKSWLLIGIFPLYFEIMGSIALGFTKHVRCFFLLVKIWRNALSKRAKPYNYLQSTKRCKMKPWKWASDKAWSRCLVFLEMHHNGWMVHVLETFAHWVFVSPTNIPPPLIEAFKSVLSVLKLGFRIYIIWWS